MALTAHQPRRAVVVSVAMCVGALLFLSIGLGTSGAFRAPYIAAGGTQRDRLAPQGIPETPVAASGARSTGGQPEASGFWFYAEGLPPNVSAWYSFAHFTTTSGTWTSGPIEDGFGGGFGPSEPGVWTLYVIPPAGYIANPASATYFVHANESLNVTLDFLPESCSQTFTEAGLPVGATWWVVEGLAFFSNGTTIDVAGCGLLGSEVIGTATDYHVVGVPPAGTFYPGGAAIPVFFGPPSRVPSFPFASVLILGLVAGTVMGLASAVGRNRGDPPEPS